MDIYHVWVNLADSSMDHEFCRRVDAFLGYFKEKGLVSAHRTTRRKLGFGPQEIGEWNIQIETRNLETLEKVWRELASKSHECHQLHHDVYALVKDFRSALYRDFPDSF